MRVLAIGGAGKVGTLIRPALEAAHELRIFDRRPVDGMDGRCIVGDVDDEAAVRAAVRDVDAVIYLAMGSRTANVDDSFGVNTKGLYRVMRAAIKAGVRRFVYASSLSIYREPIDYFVDEQVDPNGWSTYAVSKMLGESICEAAAIQAPDAKIVVLRLIRPATDQEIAEGRWPIHITSGDLSRLVLAALELSKPGVHRIQASSTGNENLPNTRAEEVLGWKPGA